MDLFEDGRFELLPAFGEASADSDNDGLSDFWEQANFLVSGKFSDRFLFAWRVCLTA